MGFLSTLGRNMKGGTSAYKELNDQRAKWVTKQLKSQGITRNTTPTGPVDAEGGGSSGMGVDIDYVKAERKAQAQWLDTLAPSTKAKAIKEFSRHSSDMDTINKYGSMATKALLASVAGGAALTAAGVIGGGAGAAGGTGAGAGTGAGTAGTAGAEAGLGYGGYGGAGGTVAGQGSALGGTSLASGASPLGGAGVNATTALGNLTGAGAAGAPAAAAGGGGATAAGGSTLGSLGSLAAQYGPAALKLGGAALPLLAAGGSKSTGTPNVTTGGGRGGTGPTGLMGGGVLGSSGLMGSPEEVEAQSRALSQTRTDWANRPNQTDMYGNQTTWSSEAVLDPATGQMVNKWTNKIVMDPQQQAAIDSEKTIKAGMMSSAEGLMGRATDAVSQPMDYSKFQQWGAVPQGDDAARQRIEGMLFDRLRPEQEQDMANLEAQVRAMGITRGMPQFDREIQKLRDSQSRSRFDAMQYAGNEMQNQFGREVTSAEYQNQLRGKQITEEQARRLQPLGEMNALRQGNQVEAPQFGKFGSSSSPGGVDYTSQYNTEYDRGQAADASNRSAWLNFGTTLAGVGASFLPGQQPQVQQPQPGVMSGTYNAQTGQRKP